MHLDNQPTITEAIGREQNRQIIEQNTRWSLLAQLCITPSFKLTELVLDA